MIGLGVGIDYALFIVTRYRQGLSDGLDRSTRPRRPSPPRALGAVRRRRRSSSPCSACRHRASTSSTSGLAPRSRSWSRWPRAHAAARDARASWAARSTSSTCAGRVAESTPTARPRVVWHRWRRVSSATRGAPAIGAAWWCCSRRRRCCRCGSGTRRRRQPADATPPGRRTTCSPRASARVQQPVQLVAELRGGEQRPGRDLGDSAALDATPGVAVATPCSPTHAATRGVDRHPDDRAAGQGRPPTWSTTCATR